ncbi:MAG: altronate dehydratase family protein [Anaerolineae bacterium]|nr:altronate dehydratase family protein [Anaerolineae bacterium]MDW8069911.1 altronate dehydratase family protein [Anaerolineae bacterium]
MSMPLHQVALHLHPDDEVVIARTTLESGTVLLLDGETGSATTLVVRQRVPAGHKLAVRHIAPAAAVHRYGQVIGFATQEILPGDHVHIHNLDSRKFPRPLSKAFPQPVQPVAVEQRSTFLGYPRPWGGVGTRNYLAVIPSVNCAADVAVAIAHYFTPERIAAWPHIDGVIPVVHQSGCTLRIGSPNYRLLQRTLAGVIRHPNVGGALLVGLGCECNQIAALLENYHLMQDPDAHARIRSVVIQESGGSRRAVQQGIALVEEILPYVDATQRAPQPLSELKIALQCGGSDSWSGVTANPLIGLVADEVVRQGGTVVLSETPEIYGAEHLLAGRAVSVEVRERLLAKVRWWAKHARQFGMELDNNPSPGNRAGGITTIYEKSLGAVAKGGNTPLMAVYEYAEPITTRGLVFMDTPGYDPVAITGQIAGGCNVVLFSTGRGSGLGSRLAPVIKVCSNSATYRAMPGDIDFNAGVILEGTEMAEAAHDLLALVIRIASGELSQSERQGFGETSFIPWSLGGTL